jgi:hypothetical protein
MKLFFSLVFAVALVAQTEAPKAQLGRVIGEVTAKDSGGKQLTVKSDAGVPYTVTLDEKTLFLRVPPGEKDLKKAAKITSDDVKVGDRVIARGTVAEEQKTVPAVSVIVMTKEDLAQKRQSEQGEWQTRGTSGIVKSVSPDSKEIVIATHTREGVTSLTTIAIGSTANVRRYAPDSVRFSDAKPSKVSDIQSGDQARVLGQKNSDGTRVEAESLVFGTFRTIAGTVISVDAANNEIKLKDLESKQPITIKINADTNMRKLPPMVATMLARRLNPSFQGGTVNAAGVPSSGNQGGMRPGAGGPDGAPQGGMRRGGADGAPAQSAAGGLRDASQRSGPGAGSTGPGGPGRSPDRPRMGGGGAPNLDAMLERAPAVTLAELQPAEPLILSTTARAGTNVANAITVLSGVEPILRAAPAGSMNLGSWSLEMNVPAQ